MAVKVSSGMKARAKMTSFDALVSSGSSAAFSLDFQKERYPVEEIAVSELHSFKNHPFPVLDDDEMAELMKSVEEFGILEPLIVRKDFSGGYEIISGHRRCLAGEKLGFLKVPVRIVELDDDSAITCMVDANFSQRKNIPISSKAKAYRQKFEALKRRGKVTSTYSEMGEAAGESGKTVQRMLRLSLLTDGLLQRIDQGKLGLIQGVTFSYLPKPDQMTLLQVLQEDGINPSRIQAEKIREQAEKDYLTPELIRVLLADKKKNTKQVVIRQEILKKYIPSDYSEEDSLNLIIALLKQWKGGTGNE